MFTFLNTSILAGLGAVLIPLFILLITRQKVKKVFFSSIIFLKELKSQKIRRIKIRNILLLILRTLAILMLLLAFARPTYKGAVNSAIESKAKTSAVIIMDNSLSMGSEIDGHTLLDEAKKKILELSDVFKNGDEIYALSSTIGTPPIYDGPRYDLPSVMKNISKLQISYDQSDIIASLRQAKAILQEAKNLNKEIYLVSDLQATGFKGIQESSMHLLEGSTIKLFVLPCAPERIDNLGIDKVESANQIIERGKVFELKALVKNHGSQAVKNKLVQLFIEGKRTAQKTVHLKPGESQSVSFNVLPDMSGKIAGSVLLEDDDLSLDNRRFFTFYIPDIIRVLLLGNREQDMRFLKLAADVSPNIAADPVLINKVSTINLNQYNVIAFSNVPRISKSFETELVNFIEDGGSLIIFLGNDVDLKDYNSHIGLRLLLPNFTESFGDLKSKNSFFTFGKIDFSHPIFNGLFQNIPEEIDSPQFYFIINARAKNHIIEFSNGSPFLSELKYGKGRVLLFCTAIDPSWTDFYMKGIFVPLINRSVMYVAGFTEDMNQETLVNEEILGSISSVNEEANFKMETPDGNSEKLKIEIDEGKYQIRFKRTDLPGIYRLFSDEKVMDKWAINSSPDESGHAMLPDKEFSELIGEDHLIFIKGSNPSREEISSARYGKELWKYFIAFVLILLCVEMWIAREPGGKVRVP